MAPRSIRSLLVVVLALIVASLASAPAQAQGNSRTFPETGKTISGAFLQYWTRHGGRPNRATRSPR
jgi:hypothetical protein